MKRKTEEPNPNRSVPQLRRSLRRWRVAAITSACLVAFSGFMLYQCSQSAALHWMWYVLGAGGVLLYSAKFIAQVVEYRNTKERIDKLDTP